MALEDARAREAQARDLLLVRVGARVAVREVLEAVVARLHDVQRRALVDRDAGRRARRPSPTAVRRSGRATGGRAIGFGRTMIPRGRGRSPRAAPRRPPRRRRAAGSSRCR